MAQTYETPPGRGGVRGDLLGGVSRSPDSLSAYRAQHLVSRFGFPSDRAGLFGSLIYGEMR